MVGEFFYGFVMLVIAILYRGGLRLERAMQVLKAVCEVVCELVATGTNRAKPEIP